MEFRVIEENEPKGEMYFTKIEAHRKGRHGRGTTPCTVKVGVTIEETPPRIVLVGIDKSGRTSLNAVLSQADAKQIAGALLHSVEHVEKNCE